jgi:hypothetical protein
VKNKFHRFQKVCGTTEYKENVHINNKLIIIMKNKVVPVLNLALHHKGVLRKRRYSSTHSLTSALDGGEWSASCPGRFTPRERAPGTHWIGGWVGPQSRSGRGGEEKNSQPPPGIEPYNPDSPARSPALYRLSYHGFN